MMTKKMMAIATIALGLLGVSCSSDDGPAVANLTLQTFNLETLTDGTTYQGWIIVDGDAKPTPKFANPSGNKTFTFIADELNRATEFILTIEQAGDNDNVPSETRILKGNFNQDSASLSFEDAVTSFNGTAGTFFMGTPTDNDDTNEDSGVWFIDNSSGSAMAGLTLNPLKNGWKYEGWVVINNVPVSTGTFTDPAQADDFNPFSSTANPAPPFPGEDFLNNSASPDGVTFPVDLRGSTVVISVEPLNDLDKAPFFLKPLTGNIQLTDAPGDLLTMNASTAIPQGQVIR
ncbi:anti-sigma factor [Aquimarina sp. BL5]|uniref:anti-sigma factor n=1 Tax=Aquimarina sp. BL5 TaxID=1714860 RepID=UPI0011C3A241|nr:anti-sigma factor [Aquimarina sp. BL5]